MDFKSSSFFQINVQNHILLEQKQLNQQEKLKEITSLVKDLKNTDNSQIFCYFSWNQIKKETNFLLNYLGRDKITDRVLFFDSLASLDSLLSIFKLRLFMELKPSKSFYRNVQKQFEFICLQLQQQTQEKFQKMLQFQLYSILFLLVMLIYFSGKKGDVQNRSLPLNIINKSFINSFVSLNINITHKNQRIVGLIVAYLIKNINIKIYGERMMKFVLSHFDRISSPRTIYHFIYCLREIHIQRQIDIKAIKKYGLIEKLISIWIETFCHQESIYIVDYINVILKKYQSLVFCLKVQPLLQKLANFEVINNFPMIHQGLILEIKAKLLPNVQDSYKRRLLQYSFKSCQKIQYSLKFLSCFGSYYSFDIVLDHIFLFLNSFSYICTYKETKCILYSIEILRQIIKQCIKNKKLSIVLMVKDLTKQSIQELKNFRIFERDLQSLEREIQQMISIQQYTLY